MPVHRKPSVPPHSHPDLVKLLAEELRKPHKTPGPGLPDVTEEEQHFGGLLHVTVIWERWKEVPREERGAIVLDAYQEAGRKEDVPRITYAMGLTAEEAERLGLEK